MDTKERILKTALELLNKHGVSTITSRHIAKEMGISHGNLHYYYKNTDEIIEILFNGMVVQFDTFVGSLQVGSIQMGLLQTAIHHSFSLMYSYRFIFLHFVEIGMRIPRIKKDYFLLIEKRKQEFFYIFNQLQEDHFFRKDIPAEVLEDLVTQIFIVGDFWLSNNELTLKLKGKKAIEHYTRIFRNMFYPYLEQPVKRYLH
jgi:AcrR family transcriptional regulator